MAVLQGGGQNLPSPCVCYPKDPMWNRVKIEIERYSIIYNDDDKRYEQLLTGKEHVIHVKIKWMMSSISF